MHCLSSILKKINLPIRTICFGRTLLFLQCLPPCTAKPVLPLLEQAKSRAKLPLVCGHPKPPTSGSTAVENRYNAQFALSRYHWRGILPPGSLFFECSNA
jgi:hypothetical protein